MSTKDLHEKKQNNANMCILVLSFDGYQDVWKPFFDLLRLHWKDCPYPVYLVTNHETPSFSGVTVIQTGDEVSWSRRARLALREIPEEYVLLLLEDYLIGNDLDPFRINDIFRFIIERDVDYYRLHPYPKAKGKQIAGSLAKKIDLKQEYGINLQAAIWKKAYFMKLLKEGDYNAWQFEVNQIQDIYLNKEKQEAVCVTDVKRVIDIHNGILKGKWMPDTLRFFKKKGYRIETGQRPVLRKSEFLKYRIKLFFIRRVLSVKIKRLIKKGCMKLGFKFVSPY